MPTKAQFRMTIITLVGFTAAMALVRLWAARHSTKDDLLGLVADGVNVAV